ncbi:hypothetical protein C1645_823749 [Glomus cerebriforme]|uniref:Uncharacterized protein n=1 Tax=Glomus cerebriforme TaxID=658196 RepID=A0A397SVT3_9GLOM|nr:hypothetical protein C1645_823749 [Glomus cerebriforme]
MALAGYYEITLCAFGNLDEINLNEQPNNLNSYNSEEEIDIDQKFPLAKGWALKGNQKLGGRGGKRMKKEVKALLELFFLNGNRRSEDRMNAQSMRDELLKYVEAGELEEGDIPKVNTIQNWINTYARIFKERATERDLANECEKLTRGSSIKEVKIFKKFAKEGQRYIAKPLTKYATGVTPGRHKAVTFAEFLPKISKEGKKRGRGRGRSRDQEA